MHCIIIIQIKTSIGVCDILCFDGASNVQNYGAILSARHPHITVGHGSVRVVSLFLSEVFQNIYAYKILAKFSKILFNVFGSTGHGTTDMFNKYSKKNSRDIKVGFIKPYDFRNIFFLPPQLYLFQILMNVFNCRTLYHIVCQSIIFIFCTFFF